MYERISTELFSNLIDKINQIPNYSTPYKENPFVKEPQKLSQLLHLYNMDSSQKEKFQKIIININDNNLRQNLIKIMLNIGTKYNYFRVENSNSSLIDEANNELLALFSSTWEYFRQKSDYLKSLSVSENQNMNREITEYEISLKETVCFVCGLINIIVFMFKKQFSILDLFNKNSNLNLNNNNNKNNFNSNKEYIQMEINMLFIIHKNRVWLEPLITLLEQIFKFVLSNSFYKFINTKLERYKKMEKEGEMSKNEIIEKINSYINFIIEDNDVLNTIFTVVKKYNSLNNINMILGSIIPINDINSLIQRFFNIYIVFYMHKNHLTNLSNEEQIYCLGIYIINCLLNCKYEDKNYGVDFIGYFYGAQKFIEETFDEINIKAINGISELISYLKAGCLFVQMPNLNVLQNLENALKDYIMYSMVTCYNKDSLCDCYMNCEKQRQMYLCYGLVRAYLIICKNIDKPIIQNKKNNDMDIEQKKQIIILNIFNNLLNELKKYNIVLPVKMLLYKNYILQSIFVVLHMIVKSFSREILEMNTDKIAFYDKISFIKELSETINGNFFMLGNDTLYYLKFPIEFNKQNNHEQLFTSGASTYLRIINESNPLNYHDIIQTKVFNPSFRTSRSNTIKYYPYLNNNIFNEQDNNEKLSVSGNFSFLNFSKNPQNPISSALFSNPTHNNINNDNAFNRSGYTIMPTNTFQSNIFKTEMKRKRLPQFNEFFYRYDITPVYENYKKEQLLSFSKVGFEYKFEDSHHYLYINPDENTNFNFSQVIYLGKKEITLTSLNNSSLYNNLKNEPFSGQIIEQLYMNLLDGFDESNKGKNCEKSLKYYDISFNMDYFGFVEKCKNFIL